MLTSKRTCVPILRPALRCYARPEQQFEVHAPWGPSAAQGATSGAWASEASFASLAHCPEGSRVHAVLSRAQVSRHCVLAQHPVPSRSNAAALRLIAEASERCPVPWRRPRTASVQVWPRSAAFEHLLRQVNSPCPNLLAFAELCSDTQGSRQGPRTLDLHAPLWRCPGTAPYALSCRGYCAASSTLWGCILTQSTAALRLRVRFASAAEPRRVAASCHCAERPGISALAQRQRRGGDGRRCLVLRRRLDIEARLKDAWARKSSARMLHVSSEPPG